MTRAIIVAFALLSTSAASAESCRVVGVSDGDTITVRCGHRDQEKVRIAEIDAPEKKQPYGTKAKQKASELIFGKDIDLRATGRDRYGRTIGYVRLPDGTDFGSEMVRSGYAWRYIGYSKDRSLTALENEARAQRLGLWSETRAQAPWEYRTAMRKARAQ